ncbi:GNAT family N-acetyltransferase [Micromonospora sp. NPDC049497]|uniref:GNAT family N-acetyltransferase n=1 Tax=Micromonospora sp. NPDC049497 TaxID=3364273 RepID=UPI0037ADA4D9
MGEARRATAADAAELVRLRGVFLGEIAVRGSAADGWQRAAFETLRTRLAAPDPTMVAFVVNRTDRPGALAASAVGAVDCRLGGPDDPTSERGYVFNVVTEPDQRRRGYARLCMAALLTWYGDRGIRTVDLRTSAGGEPLYRSLGFVRTTSPAMRLRLPTPGAAEVSG